MSLAHFDGPNAPAAPRFIREHLPALIEASALGVDAWQWLAMIAALAGAVGFGIGLSRLFHLVSRRVSKRPQTSWFVSLTGAIQNPLASLLALAVFDLAVHFIDLVGQLSTVVDTAARALMIGEAGWLLVVGGGWLAGNVENSLLADDEYKSRGPRTQVRLANRVWSGLVALIALALILSGFRAVRTIGVSLLASAGIVGIVFGIAAQKSLAVLVAGLQLSVTQQIRIGDTLMVDGEIGCVEEIHLTFAVIRLWDLRRQIVPANHFLEAPFQNWTRTRTHLIGSVELWVDYATPLAPLRAQLARLCAASPLWDGKTASLQVLDASDKALKLRVLLSAVDYEHLFDLRCEVREKLIAALQLLEGGIYLPHDRTSSVAERGPRAG